MKWIKINENKLPFGDYLCTDSNDVSRDVYFGTIHKDKDGVYVNPSRGICQPVTHYMPLQSLSNIEFE